VLPDGHHARPTQNGRTVELLNILDDFSRLCVASSAFEVTTAADVVATFYDAARDWRYHVFVTNLDTPAVDIDAFRRDHATIELAIRDLKDGADLEHCPSGHFFANAA
jgi:hypothetical protein